MKFQAAYSYLKRGHAIALPEWGGYWQWDNYKKSINMHLRDGGVMDMRQSDDMDYTISFIFRDDWQLLDSHAVAKTEHRKNSAANAKELLDEVIEDANKGDVINLAEIANTFHGFDPLDLFPIAETYWAAGTLEQGGSEKEYIIQ
ncbi:hypothetical protein ACIGG6_02125 [Vreelandella lionensis]|uniref:Uncharacterized protein n=1 Tax=Vreelandella lionensis TaxID=1144478 RepID=A0ABW8BNL0_9GAMM